MSEINDLELDDSVFEGAPDVEESLPQTQSDLVLENYPPGRYRFTLPSHISDIFAPVNFPSGRFLEARFEKSNTLMIALPNGATGQVRWKVTNAPRTVYVPDPNVLDANGRPTRVPVIVAGGNFDYLLKAVGSKLKARSHVAYADALTEAAGRTFAADLVYSTKCKDCKTSWKLRAYKNEKKGITIGAIPRDEKGKLEEKFNCVCGRMLYIYSDLQNIAAE